MYSLVADTEITRVIPIAEDLIELSVIHLARMPVSDYSQKFDYFVRRKKNYEFRIITSAYFEIIYRSTYYYIYKYTVLYKSMDTYQILIRGS